MSPRIIYQPQGEDGEEVAAEAVREALQHCFEPVIDQVLPDDMLRILVRAVPPQSAGRQSRPADCGT
ncbi:MAG: hypothetical protein J0H82_26185 [Alphaproteobacteria bacterium]|nr:hypothetical protein [Alphaproteobacteria bacterium]